MTAQPLTTFDLGQLALAHGDGRRIDVPVQVADMMFGDERYTVPGGEVEARLEVSRTMGGYALRLLSKIDVTGPCMRCLEPVTLRFDVEAREVDERSASDEELHSPYVEGGEELALGAWVRDELALEVPQRFLCRPEAGNLCPACGRDVSEVIGESVEPAPDPRWAKLRELSE